MTFLRLAQDLAHGYPSGYQSSGTPGAAFPPFGLHFPPPRWVQALSWAWGEGPALS